MTEVIKTINKREYNGMVIRSVTALGSLDDEEIAKCAQLIVAMCRTDGVDLMEELSHVDAEMSELEAVETDEDMKAYQEKFGPMFDADYETIEVVG